MTRVQILVEALALSAREREALADDLLATLTEADAAEIDAAWLADQGGEARRISAVKLAHRRSMT